jgi:hypothetical protein
MAPPRCRATAARALRIAAPAQRGAVPRRCPARSNRREQRRRGSAPRYRTHSSRSCMPAHVPGPSLPAARARGPRIQVSEARSKLAAHGADLTHRVLGLSRRSINAGRALRLRPTAHAKTEVPVTRVAGTTLNHGDPSGNLNDQGGLRQEARALPGSAAESTR